METGMYNTWGDTVWKWPWSCLASQNNLAEVLLFKTGYFLGGEGRGERVLLLKKKLTVWRFLIKNL